MIFDLPVGGGQVERVRHNDLSILGLLVPLLEQVERIVGRNLDLEQFRLLLDASIRAITAIGFLVLVK
jgi:hypothetical protein